MVKNFLKEEKQHTYSKDFNSLKVSKIKKTKIIKLCKKVSPKLWMNKI